MTTSVNGVGLLARLAPMQLSTMVRALVSGGLSSDVIRRFLRYTRRTPPSAPLQGHAVSAIKAAIKQAGLLVGSRTMCRMCTVHCSKANNP